MKLLIEYSWWFLLLCILLGALYSGVLYYKNKKQNEQPDWLLSILAACRFIVVTLLAFFLLSPLLKSAIREVKKPIIIIAQDNSASILIGKDSSFYREKYLTDLQDLKNNLANKYQVELFQFGDKVTPVNSFKSVDYNYKETSYSALLEELETRYANRNVGALIVATDGLYNKGKNPLYTSTQLNAPLYSVALGDTTVKKDLILSKVLHNDLTFLGNEFPLEVVVNAKAIKGNKANLNVWYKNKAVFSQKINIPTNNYSITLPVLLNAAQKGIQHYTVTLSEIEGEVTTINNRMEVYIDVLDAKQKVLILTDSPHPDVGAIAGSLNNNKNYEVDRFTLSSFNKALKQYDLVILNQIALSKGKAVPLMNELKNLGIPLWVISGSSTLIGLDLEKEQLTSQSNVCEAVVNENFPLFAISPEMGSQLATFPPLYCPYGTLNSSTNSYALFYQQIGTVATNRPLLSFKAIDGRKLAILNGEGLWKWRLHDFLRNGNHDVFDELIAKTVQYLAIKENKSLFRVNCDNSFLENQTIQLRAEVYNESYELTTVPEVNLNITNADGRKYPFSFSVSGTAYVLNAGVLPVGEYLYNATTKVGNKLYVKKGQFTIQPIQVEALNSIANHQLLHALASQKGGEMVYPNELDKLNDIIQGREDIQAISYIQNRLTDLINLKWLFFLLLGLLTTEWFLRKRNGI